MNLPPTLNWLWQGWMAFSKAFGRVMSFIILTILWIVGFGVYAIIAKIIAATRRVVPASTYWIDHRADADDLHRQF